MTSEFRSSELNELFTALSKAQSEIKVAIKDANNPFFKSSYANLQSIIESSRPALCKNGLSIVQQIIHENDRDFLMTLLGHSSGQWILSKAKLSPAKPDVQSLGSYITYLRRYSYAALVGVYDGDDDDGNEATAQQESISITKYQKDIILKYVSQQPDLLNAIYSQYKVSSLDGLKSSDAGRLINQLSK